VITFMERLPRRLAQEVLSLGWRRTYTDGDHLVRQGDGGDFVVVLLRGQVKVVSVTAAGRSCLLGVRRAGDLVGEMSMVDEGPRCASVIADGLVSGQSIPAPRFARLMQTEPDVSREVARTMTGRLREADIRRADFTYPVLVRVMRLLAEHVPEGAAPDRPAAVRLTQREVADLVGAAEVSVQKALRELVAAGLATTGYGVLVVPGSARLLSEAHRLMETRHRL
jgi:CRP/FNR family cyclic AMP-dependent transcriptional regulator